MPGLVLGAEPSPRLAGVGGVAVMGRDAAFCSPSQAGRCNGGDGGDSQAPLKAGQRRAGHTGLPRT